MTSSLGRLAKGSSDTFFLLLQASLFCLFDRSLVGISISPFDDVMHNYASLGAKATAALHISPFRFSRFAQVISRPKAQPMVLSVVFSRYLSRNLGGAMHRHEIAQHLPPTLMLS